MTTTINASPSNGIVQTADGSGIIKIQSDGKTTNALAWASFSGVTTVTIRASYNVSSITRNGTGDYTINFSNALADANYAPTQMGWLSAGNIVNLYENLISSTKTTSAYRVISYNTSGATQDTSNGYIAIFGN